MSGRSSGALANGFYRAFFKFLEQSLVPINPNPLKLTTLRCTPFLVVLITIRTQKPYQNQKGTTLGAPTLHPKPKSCMQQTFAQPVRQRMAQGISALRTGAARSKVTGFGFRSLGAWEFRGIGLTLPQTNMEGAEVFGCFFE